MKIAEMVEQIKADSRDAARYAKLRAKFVESAEVMSDTVNTVRASVTVSRYLPADCSTVPVLCAEFDRMVDDA